MQINEIKQHFNNFEQCVHDAMQACQQESNVSPRLADTIRDLDREVRGAHDMVINAQEESDDLIQCIDRLEEMGDDAKRACQSSSGLSNKMQSTILGLHKEISTLKHQLH